MVQTINRRVIRKLRHLGYLEAGSNDAVVTGYDPLLSAAPELARIMAVSVTQRIAFGERAGQQVWHKDFLQETIELFRNKRQGKLSSKKAMEGANQWGYSSETTVR